jgi:hypothetical protein
MIHHNQDSERHEVFGVKEFKNNSNEVIAKVPINPLPPWRGRVRVGGGRFP